LSSTSWPIAVAIRPLSAFHDITKGNNTIFLAGKQVKGYQAGPGWDPVTGWGTPVASVLVPLLARYDAA
jgi:hypothetical protein